jgi:DNA-nicking Smr family endonuclease
MNSGRIPINKRRHRREPRTNEWRRWEHARKRGKTTTDESQTPHKNQQHQPGTQQLISSSNANIGLATRKRMKLAVGHHLLSGMGIVGPKTPK